VTAARARRIPAGNLETVVIDRLRTFFSNRGELLDAIENEGTGKAGPGDLISRGRQIAVELGRTPDKTKAMVMTLVRRVEVRRDHVKIDIYQRRVAGLPAANLTDLPTQPPTPVDSSEPIITLKARAQMKRVGREMKLLVDDDANRTPDMSLLRIVARAHDIQTRLAQDTTLAVHDVARDEHVTAAHIYVLLRLRWLAPDITTAIVNGQHPPQLSAKKLMRLTAHLPAQRTEQRALLGFR
jgi:site-specific DNA recombinase